jgi:LPS export ABC transporter protein LptC
MSWRSALLLVTLAGVAFGAAACGETGVRPTATVQAADTADQVLAEVSHYITDDGVRRSLVKADTAYFYDATQTAELLNITVVFYDDNGNETSTLTAEQGTYRWQSGSMEARGNVVVVSPDGERLETSVLRYDEPTETISTDQRFTYTTPEEYLEGNGFTSDPDFESVVTDQPRGGERGVIDLPGQEEP